VSTISDRGLISVSTLDFLWGFANGLVGGLSAQIQTLLGSSPSHTIALNNIFYCAYFVGPLLVGYWVLNLAGFKATFITGLAIYAVGALAFWPSSVLLSYAGFVVSNFMLALGLSCLELAAQASYRRRASTSLRDSLASVSSYPRLSQKRRSFPASIRKICSACNGATLPLVSLRSC
jgi:MFS family permease